MNDKPEDPLEEVAVEVLHFLEDAYFAHDEEEEQAVELAKQLRKALYSA